MIPIVRVAADPAALAEEAAREVVAAAASAIEASGRFTIALAGGDTPRTLYRLLSAEPYRRAIRWAHVDVFWSDERCVPPADPRSNYRMARETLLDRLPLPAPRIHRIRCEMDPVQAAAAYEEELREVAEQGLDLVLLGLGSDGHTASLFPGDDALREAERWVLARRVEAAGGWRVTLAPPALNAARRVLFLVSGASKADALRQTLGGPRDPVARPAQSIVQRPGSPVWIVDREAGALLGDWPGVELCPASRHADTGRRRTPPGTEGEGQGA